MQHAKNSLVLALCFAEIEIKQVFLKNASRNKLKASVEVGTGMWPTPHSTKGSTSVYCYVSEYIQELLSYYMKHNFKWNVFLEVNWRDFWTQWCQLGCVCWHVTMSQQTGICSPCCLQTLQRMEGYQERQAALGKHGNLRRSLTKHPNLIPRAVHLEKQRSPTPAQ